MGASLVAQMVKNLPAMQGSQVQSPGGEDSMEKGRATHSSILAWRTPWTKEPWSGLQSVWVRVTDCGLQSMGSQRVGRN